LASCISSEYRYTYSPYDFKMQKLTTALNMRCCILITYNHNGLNWLWQYLANMWHWFLTVSGWV